jgi:hypothetical protein
MSAWIDISVISSGLTAALVVQLMVGREPEVYVAAEWRLFLVIPLRDRRLSGCCQLLPYPHRRLGSGWRGRRTAAVLLVNQRLPVPRRKAP